jgi:hemerythrin-like metal-binding protein
MTQSTGHAEIDQQHSILEELIAEFGAICPPKNHTPGIQCRTCSPETKSQCIRQLSNITIHLLTFIEGHFNYEEKLMGLLPENPSCLSHIAEHKRGHQEIIHFVQQLTTQIGIADSNVIAHQINSAMSQWLGEHNANLDTTLVAQLSAEVVKEIEMDSSLVSILDHYVFPNRPNHTTLRRTTRTTRKTEKNDPKRLSNLTDRQKEVCQLVANGLSNKEIAVRLGTTINTVKTHRSELYKRLGVSSLFELLSILD